MGAPTPRQVTNERSPLTEGQLPGGPRLLWAADGLLALIPQLRATGFVSDLTQLRDKLAAMLRDFQARARSLGMEPEHIGQAMELLAALIDYVVLTMPWGVNAGWRHLGAAAAAGAQRTPQGTAERLLEVARRASADPGTRELVGIALALGFEGGGRGTNDGIDRLRGELAAQESPAAARIAHSLSPQWQAAVGPGSALAGWLPLWASTAIVAALLAVLFFALERSLGVSSDRLYARIAALNGPAAPAARPLPASQPRLAGLLAEPLAARNASVRDEIDRSVIVVPGSALFAAGGAALQPEGTTLLRGVAAALARTPGRVQIIGHTDGGGVRSARYPSDWDLSVDRARAVENALRELGIEGSRLSYDGRAGIEPSAAEGRVGSAADGRIEIVLLAGR